MEEMKKIKLICEQFAEQYPEQYPGFCEEVVNQLSHHTSSVEFAVLKAAAWRKPRADWQREDPLELRRVRKIRRGAKPSPVSVCALRFKTTHNLFEEVYGCRYTVWVGGVEANDYMLTRGEADRLAAEYEADGYDDVVVSRV